MRLRYGSVHVRDRHREQLPDDRMARARRSGRTRWQRRDTTNAGGRTSGCCEELGIEYLRYGPPYYLDPHGAGPLRLVVRRRDLRALREQTVTPIADLCHFGVPDWVGDFQNPDWPKLFAEYAGAFAQRFPWVRFYTPVNEIFIAATFSAQFGWWNERLTTDRAFVTALKHLCKANVLAMHAILKVRPDAIFIQSESSQ